MIKLYKKLIKYNFMKDILKNKMKIYYLLIFLILSYSIYIKFYFLWEQSFWIDEWFSSYVSMEFFNNGFNFMKPEYFLHNFSQVLSFNIFWVSDFSSRFFSVIFSIINTVFIYLISFKLFKDKKQAIFSTLIFSFLTWEIIWARQARFYSLLQLIFSINLYLNISIVKNILEKKVFLKYLNIFIIISYIWILFHPFLYSNLVIFLVSIFSVIFVKIVNNKNSLKYNLSTEGFSPLKVIKQKFFSFLFNKYFNLIWTFFILLIIFWIEVYKYIYLWESLWVSSDRKLPEHFIESYINNYNNHLFSELWILYFLFIISFFIFAIKRKFLELIFLGFSFLFIFYVISQKWFLFHTRYVLILFPLIIIWASYSIVYFYKSINSFCQQRALALWIIKYIYIIIIFILILLSAKFTFLPQKEYLIDYTSPQPNFKQAYNIIPNNSKIISWFPMMCEWYFWKKWECIYHLPVDYVWSPESVKHVLERWKDNYTKLPYLLNLDQLEKQKKYYFVLDDLSIKRTIGKNILKELFDNWKIIFDDWIKYNNIKVIEYIK